MLLARVGNDLGPEFERLSELMAKAGNRRIWAAGGFGEFKTLKNLPPSALRAHSLHPRCTTAG